MATNGSGLATDGTVVEARKSDQLAGSIASENKISAAEVKFHPLAKEIPLMEGEEFDALVADIRANGLLNHIILYDDMILDGRNRYRALRELGYGPAQILEKFTYDGYYGGVVSDPLAGVISANIRRKHLTADQKRDAIAKLLKADPSKSDRQVAKTVKASPTFVGKVRAEKEATGELSTVDSRIGADGKARKQPKKRKRKPRHEIDQTKQPPRAEVRKLVSVWVKATAEAKREFVRERWDEIARVRKQLDANGAAQEDRWIEGDTL